MSDYVFGPIYKESCPQCKTDNFYDCGNPADQSRPDVGALECWKCGRKWLIEGREEWVDDIDKAYCVTGAVDAAAA